MFISNEERELGTQARAELDWQSDNEWPTSLFMTESMFCNHVFINELSKSGDDILPCKKCGYNYHYTTMPTYIKQ